VGGGIAVALNVLLNEQHPRITPQSVVYHVPLGSIIALACAPALESMETAPYTPMDSYIASQVQTYVAMHVRKAQINEANGSPTSCTQPHS
jgi:hypothetical protein